MNNFTSPKYWRFYQALPAEIQKLADKNLQLLKKIPGIRRFALSARSQTSGRFVLAAEIALCRLTETVWALAGEVEPIAPQRVVVTTEGKAAMERDLFTPMAVWDGHTVWQTLRDSVRQRLGLAANEPLLNFEPVHVFTTPDAKSGRAIELADLRTRSDNDDAADFLLEQVRGLVENPDTHLIILSIQPSLCRSYEICK